MGSISFFEWFFLGMPWEWIVVGVVFVAVPTVIAAIWDYGRERLDRRLNR